MHLLQLACTFLTLSICPIAGIHLKAALQLLTPTAAWLCLMLWQQLSASGGSKPPIPPRVAHEPFAFLTGLADGCRGPSLTLPLALFVIL